ncbi:XRE family transcriptional regulator [uncultured Lactobacillus sp.]|uniref:XRE family transcriptional regulator n=1 Tax=uncultured Lactobacillus sp. TaxID=153152 RepID=UPI0025F069EC|nr:XRE family transcriptional regulator [uncultured Lactobacillus sp.]
MPTIAPGRRLVQKYLKDNRIKITELAKIYGLNPQDASDYISGRKSNPAANHFILSIVHDLKL